MAETFEDWIKEGEEAYYSGVSVYDCPHGLYSDKAQSWRRGWANAKFAESLNGTVQT